MIVCCCRGLSHKKILSVIQEGAKSVEDVTSRCGAGGDCGSCTNAINQMLQSQQNERPGAGGGCRAPQAKVDAP